MRRGIRTVDSKNQIDLHTVISQRHVALCTIRPSQSGKELFKDGLWRDIELDVRHHRVLKHQIRIARRFEKLTSMKAAVS